MLTVKVPLKEAEKTKKKLLKDSLLDIRFDPVKESGFIFFPVNKKFDTKLSFVEKKLSERFVKKSLKESLTEKLSAQELELLNTSMDIIGTIAIIEIPDELKSREKLIADEALKASKNIKTVLLKGKHEGVFRTQELKWLSGVKTKEAVYKENGVTLKVDVEKVYFSPRLSNERIRIAKLVKKNEDVLVMFSGCSPYVCVIAKNSNAKSIVGIEINPEGHKYALENLKINKIKNAEVFCGDVRDIVPKLKRKFDRIIMPLPKTADAYLDVAFFAAKPNAIIHFYDFEMEDETDKGVKKVKKASIKAKRKFKVLNIVKTGQPAPHAYRFSIDFKVD